MKKLLRWINGLTPEARAVFEGDIGTSINYIRKAASIGQLIAPLLCIRIEMATSGFVRCEDLRPDLMDEWAHIRKAPGLYE